MNQIENILENIEDKTQNLSTTSLRFKTELYGFITGLESAITAVEFGTHKGQTTRVLSHCCSKVYTINKSEEHLVEAKKLNSDRENIKYIPFDLYGHSPMHNPWLNEFVDLVFIDAGHDTSEVVHDIKRALYICKSNRYLVFDDYGMFDSVYNAIEQFSKSLINVMEIGHQPGYTFAPGKTLKRSEGLICKII